MALTFADTHNMIMYLTRSDVSEGFEQILDFLNASVIQYALMVKPTIYVSCIKQFWSSVLIKKMNEVVRLQALIDRRKVIITEDTVGQALHLDDAKSVDCFPNEEIFAGLARMGYEKLSTKLTFYKAFFSAQWKFLIHTILQCMSAKRTTQNEFSSSMASAVICLATGRKFNFSKYIFDNLQDADDVADVIADDVATDDVDDVDAKPTPPSPIPATTPPPPQQEMIKRMHPNRREIAEIAADEDVTLEEVVADLTKDAEVQGRQEESQAQEGKGRQCSFEIPTLKRKPQTEAQARKNIMVYLKNMAGFKMNFFKCMSYDDIRPIFEKNFNSIVSFLEKGEEQLEEKASQALKRKSKSSKQQAVKKQKFDEEVEELKKHLQIIPNDEDNVYTEATPLALKVPVVDYQIHTENNKPYYKIIRADGTH
uniref:Synaptobrevin, longin-like domain protein n=1 Tax=Tanacetum cinerariifolium TaxID=118510 RepID=A0A6L2LHW2_TANCI|nr:hypothetical protein [Tanacetum cinerariifolium]